jgi:hypothetical protein
LEDVDNDDATRGGDEYECRKDRGWPSLGGLRGWSRNGDDEAVSADAVPEDDKLAARGRCLVVTGFVDAARVPEAVGEGDGAEVKWAGVVGNAEPTGEEPSPAASPPAEGDDNGRELGFRPAFRDESRDAEEEEEDDAEAAPAGCVCMTITLTGGLKAAPCPSTSPSRRFARWFRKGSGRQVLETRFLESRTPPPPPTSSEPAAQGKLLHPPVPGSCLRGDSCERISPSPEEEQGQELSRSSVRGEPGDVSRAPLTMMVMTRRGRAFGLGLTGKKRAA